MLSRGSLYDQITDSCGHFVKDVRFEKRNATSGCTFVDVFGFSATEI